MKNIIKFLFASVMLLSTGVSNAAFITINDTLVSAYQLSDNDFESFYRKNIRAPDLSTSVFSIYEELVMFVARGVNGNYGIVTIFNDKDKRRSKGTLPKVRVGVSGPGVLNYSDDDGDEFTDGYVWSQRFTDGFIWEVIGNNWDVDFNFSGVNTSNSNGVNVSGATFLTFDDQNNVSVARSIDFNSNEFNAQVKVSAPGISMLFALGLGILFLRRKA